MYEQSEEVYIQQMLLLYTKVFATGPIGLTRQPEKIKVLKEACTSTSIIFKQNIENCKNQNLNFYVAVKWPNPN